MKLALASVCPGGRENRWLPAIIPTWEAYARRHALRLHVGRRHPRPEAPYWGKYFVFEQPELAGCDAVLVVDNDVVIGPEAPLPTEGWDQSRVRIGDEGFQFPHEPTRYSGYYEGFGLSSPRDGYLVLNTGVLLYTREHAAWFRRVFEEWRAWRAASHPGAAPAHALARLADDLSMHDQPHVSRALQLEDRFQLLDSRFNRLWWSWWADGGRRPELPLKLYAKSIEMLRAFGPTTLARALAAPGRRWWNRALREEHFIHVAGSKSPLAFLNAVPSRR